MKTKLVASVLVPCVAVVAALAALTFSPFGVASGGGVDVTSVLSELEPGATVETQRDGSVAFRGKLSPAADAEVRAAGALEAAGPSALRCDTPAATGVLKCTQVPDVDVISELRQGVTIYGRAVYRSITREVTDRANPLLESGELVCNTDSKPVTCNRVDEITPVIPASATLFVTYRPFHVSFTDERTVISHLEKRSVPISRAAGP